VKRALLALLIAGITTQANAYEFTAGGTVVAGEGKYSSVLGAVTTSFNSGTLPSNYSGGLVLIGTHPFALPPGGESSFYYEPLNAPETASLGSLASYFGYFWGSPDDGDNIELLRGGNVIATFTGTELANAAGIRIGGAGDSSDYLNIFAQSPAEYFDQVRFAQGTFETDNHAFLEVQAVPEPSTALLMLGSVAMFLGLCSIRRTAQSRPPRSCQA